MTMTAYARLRYSLLGSFFAEVVVPVCFVAGSLAIASAALYTGLDRTGCRANGEAMGIEVEWGFWTGCMVNLRGQLLPWSEVVPVERNGKIVFEPKPVVRLQQPDQK